MRKNECRGLSQVGVLVIVAVIVVLGIVAVQFVQGRRKTAREVARTLACVANLQKVGRAFSMQIEKEPTISCDNWVETIRPYCRKTKATLECPAVGRSSEESDYGMCKKADGLRISRIEDPKHKPLFADAKSLTFSGIDDLPHDRHIYRDQKAVNVFFVDLHAERVPVKDLQAGWFEYGQDL